MREGGREGRRKGGREGREVVSIHSLDVCFLASVTTNYILRC